MRLPAEDLRRIASEWRTARRIYAIYMAVGQQEKLKLAPCPELDSPIDRADPAALERVCAWLDAAEAQIAPHDLRVYCQTNAMGEPALRALVTRVLKKEKRQESDRDKLDFLIVQYFTQCAPMKAQRDDVRLNEVAAVLEILLGEVDPAEPAWLEPLDELIDRLKACHSLGELLAGKLLAEGRKIKIGANGRYYSPAVLVAFTRYNFIARRTFFRLVQRELEALRAELAMLTKAGVSRVDCRVAKLGEDESVGMLKAMADAWKQPFRAEYSEGMTFEQLVAVREAVHKAVVATGVKPAAMATAAGIRSLFTGAGVTDSTDTRSSLAKNPSAETVPPKPLLVEAEFRSIRAQLSETLSHAASAENAMTRITLGSQRLVLSSWEVHGFLEPNEEFSQAMQDGVSTRVLVERELEMAKAGKHLEHLPALIKFAHAQAAAMQEHVAQARDARDIDAAVTLAATSKRLTQLLQEAAHFTTGAQ